MPRRKFRKRYRKRSNLPRKNYRNIKMLKNAIEHKFLDSKVTIATIDDAPDDTHYEVLNLVDCNDVSADEDPDQQYRNGREIYATRIKIRGYITNTNGTPADGVLRIILARWKNNSTGVAAPSIVSNDGILDNFSDNVGTVNSFLNSDVIKNWDILVDTTFGYDTTQYSQIPFKINKKLNHTVRFDNATGTSVNNVINNAMILYAISNQAVEANAPSIVLESRYSFMDL